MSLKSLAVIGGIFATVTILPLSAAAKNYESCTPGPTSPAAYAGDFSREGADLLAGIAADAATVLNRADRLMSFQSSVETGWASHTAELVAVSENVNDMGRKLCRLETIHSTLPDWQQQAITRSEPAVLELANAANRAIEYVNGHQHWFLNPAYMQEIKYLDTRAEELSNSVRSFEQFAKASQKEMRLEKSLGLKKAD